MVGKQFARTGEILAYQTEDGKTRVKCRFEQETMWLFQALISELFQVSVPTVNEHLRNIFDEVELILEANSARNNSFQNGNSSNRGQRRTTRKVKQDREYFSDFDRAFNR
ncbi:MAG: hypothetical protein AB9866_23590 [Syntrophobacteraceae bacterium]